MASGSLTAILESLSSEEEDEKEEDEEDEEDEEAALAQVPLTGSFLV